MSSQPGDFSSSFLNSFSCSLLLPLFCSLLPKWRISPVTKKTPMFLFRQIRNQEFIFINSQSSYFYSVLLHSCCCLCLFQNFYMQSSFYFGCVFSDSSVACTESLTSDTRGYLLERKVLTIEQVFSETLSIQLPWILTLLFLIHLLWFPRVQCWSTAWTTMRFLRGLETINITSI